MPLPPESVLPGTAGIAFCLALKRWLRVEVDQEASVRFNGDTTNANKLSPIATPNGVLAYFEKWGSTSQLYVVNRSSFPLRARVWSAE